METIEDIKEALRSYRMLRANIEAIEKEIESLYYPISSVPMSSDGAGRNSLPGNPTERAVWRIQKEKARLENKLEELEAVKDQIDHYIDNCPDPEAAVIMRYHYVQGMSWRETDKAITKTWYSDFSRKYIQRFLKNEGKRRNRRETQ